MSARRHMNRYQSWYKREFCPMLDMIISTKNTLSGREMVFTFVVPEKNTWPSLGDTDWQVLTEIWELIAKKMPRIWSRRVSQASWSFAYSNSEAPRQVRVDKKKIIQQQGRENAKNCWINPQLMNFKELIGLLSEVEVCLFAELAAYCRVTFCYITKWVFGGSILLEELMAEHGSA